MLLRLMRRARAAGRSAKRRAMEVLNARRKVKRKKAYRELIKVTRAVLAFARRAVRVLATSSAPSATAWALDITHFADPGDRVVDQTHRRLVRGERVPSGDKLVSIFEGHTDVVIKEALQIEYGRKLCLAAGASGIVTDCIVLAGNPNDATLVPRMLDRHIEIFGAAPRQIAMDGGFTSKDNVREAKERGVVDVCFSKRRGMSIEDMARSRSTYRRLRRFRAGVEGIISFLKRSFGLGRCTWRGLAYVQLSVLAHNLLVRARLQLE